MSALALAVPSFVVSIAVSFIGSVLTGLWVVLAVAAIFCTRQVCGGR
jgi:hypothetical protein